MSFSLLFDYLTWRSSMIMAARYDDVAAHTVAPLSVTLPGKTLLLQQKEDAVLILHQLRLALIARQIRWLKPEIIAVSLPGANQRVWMKWHAFNIFGQDIASAESNYQLDNSNGTLRVAAMNHTTMLVPELAQASYRKRLIRSRT